MAKTRSRRPAATDAFSTAERHSAAAKVMQLALSPEFEDIRLDARDFFFGDDFGELPSADQHTVLSYQACEIGYNTFLLFDVEVDPGTTLTSLYIERHAGRLSRGELRYLTRMNASRMGLFEVERVDRDRGLDLVNMIEGNRCYVHERRATETLVAKDVVAARVMRGARDGLDWDGAVYPFTQLQAHDFMKWYHSQAGRLAKRGFSDIPKQAGAALINLYFIDAVLLRPPPRFTTTTGEGLLFCRTIFDVRDARALGAALALRPEIEPDGESWVWLNAGERPIVLGTFRLEGRRFVCETMSRERAERARELVAAIAGDAVRFSVIETETIDSMRANLRSAPAQPEPASPIPPDVQREIVEQSFVRHYSDWLDTPLPILGNRTPRRAARLKTVRPVLVALLKDMEREAQRSRAQGKPAYDFAWMWDELELQPFR